MGLDISAYKYIKFISTEEPNMNTIYFRLPVNHHFKDRCKYQEGFYSYLEEYKHFRAGSYSGYNSWRNQLAIAAGYKNDEEVFNLTSGHFYELINFSDCKGTIDCDVSKKLYNDFVTYEEDIKSKTTDSFFMSKYYNFMNAFKHASYNGCVVFS